jgi:hypothetical protein
LAEQQPVDLWTLSDLCTPWCVHVVATLRIADHIAAGTDEVDRLAAAANCDPVALRQVLRHLVGKGVFAEPAPGRFALNAAARGLLDPAARLGLDLDDLGGRMAHAWGTLLTLVRTGESAYHEVFGRPFWDDLEAHPPIAVEFDVLMGPAGHGTPDPEVLVDGNWDSVRMVVDVGGGTGALLAEILRTHSGLRGTLVDLPRTVARADEVFAVAGVADRVTTVAQSFFDPLPAGADLYVLKSIINDWPDQEATAILRRCAEAASPRGRVVVIGGISPDEAPTGLTIEAVLVGGKQRTIVEFRDLADAAGLAVVATGRQPSDRFVVECRPRAGTHTE